MACLTRIFFLLFTHSLPSQNHVLWTVEFYERWERAGKRKGRFWRLAYSPPLPPIPCLHLDLNNKHRALIQQLFDLLWSNKTKKIHMCWKESATWPPLWSWNPSFLCNKLPFLIGNYICKCPSEISPHQGSLTGLYPQTHLPKFSSWPEERA